MGFAEPGRDFIALKDLQSLQMPLMGMDPGVLRNSLFTKGHSVG